MRNLPVCSMNHYVDRADKEMCIEIADNLLVNRICLWGNVYFSPSKKNMFDSIFETTDGTYREYLFAMDYLSALLSAYQKTKDQRYQEKFLDIVSQFFEYYDRTKFSLTPEDDLIPCGQTLMFIKSFSIILYKEPLKEKIVALLYRYSEYCFNDHNHRDDNNHGLFTDMALLHLSVLFSALPEAMQWRKHAIKRVKQLFNACFDKDGFNNEGSLFYFWHNLVQYDHITTFCNAYQIRGLEMVQQRLTHAKQMVFRSFIRHDGSLPIIGDGEEFFSQVEPDEKSAFYPNTGICVVKIGEMYLTFKCNSAMQSHTHVDDSSITARFQGIDVALDSGQYDYDRYHPVNRYLRTSGGHSGVFPLFTDGLSLKEYLNRRSKAGIDQFEFDGEKYLISGGYELDGGAICVRRSILIDSNCIVVRDSWICTAPQNIRQRFVLPEEFLDQAHFIASKRTFETAVGKTNIKYEINADNTSAVTTMNFGVFSKHYMEVDSTILLDTIVENSQNGEIIAVITLCTAE